MSITIVPLVYVLAYIALYFALGVREIVDTSGFFLYAWKGPGRVEVRRVLFFRQHTFENLASVTETLFRPLIYATMERDSEIASDDEREAVLNRLREFGAEDGEGEISLQGSMARLWRLHAFWRLGDKEEIEHVEGDPGSGR